MAGNRDKPTEAHFREQLAQPTPCGPIGDEAAYAGLGGRA
jgi:hypothetical protein